MKSKERLWTYSFTLLFIIGAFNAMGFSITSPIVSKYAFTLGANLSIAGVIAGLFSTTAMYVRPVTGFAADKFSKKKLLIISSAGITISLFGYAFAPNLIVFCIFRFLHGVFYAVCGTVSNATVAFLVPKSRMGEGISLFSFVNVIASAVAPSIAVKLGSTVGYRWSFAAAAIMTAIGCFLSVIFKDVPNTNTSNNGNKRDIKLSNFIALSAIPLAVVSGLFSMTNSIISTFLVQLGEERSIANISIYFTIKAFALVVTRHTVGKFADKTKLSFIYYTAVCFEIIMAVLLARASSIGFVIAAAICKAMGQGIGQPAIQTQIMKETDPEFIGVATSTFYLASDAGQGLGPMFGGILSDHIGYKGMFFVMAAILLSGAIYYAFIVTKRKHSKG